MFSITAAFAASVHIVRKVNGHVLYLISTSNPQLQDYPFAGVLVFHQAVAERCGAHLASSFILSYRLQ